MVRYLSGKVVWQFGCNGIPSFIERIDIQHNRLTVRPHHIASVIISDDME